MFEDHCPDPKVHGYHEWYWRTIFRRNCPGRVRDAAPCNDWRPTVPDDPRCQLCVCGWPRTIASHGDTGNAPVLDLDGIWARVVAGHAAKYHPGEACVEAPNGRCAAVVEREGRADA